MKRLPAALTLLACFALLHSCEILALHPLAEGEDVIVNEKHFGKWEEVLYPGMVEDVIKMYGDSAVNTLEDLQNLSRTQSIAKMGKDSLSSHIEKLSIPPLYEFEERRGHYGITKTSYEEMNGAWGFTTARFEMVLTQIDGNYWASFTQDADNLPPRSSTLAMRSFLIQGNGMARITFEGNEMHIRFLKYDWFREVLKKNRLRIEHELVGQGDNTTIILTANTRQLRALMAKVANEPEAFEDEYLTLVKTE